MAEKILRLNDVTIDIVFDDKTGKIKDGVIVLPRYRGGGMLPVYPEPKGILVKINPLGDGWRQYIVPE